MVTQLAKKFPLWRNTCISIQCSQQPAFGPYFLVSFMHTTCRAHHFLLYLIILIISVKEYTFNSSFLYKFLYFPALFSLSCFQIFVSSYSSQTFRKNARFPVLMVTSIKTTVFWDVALSSQVKVYRHFRGACCLHYQGDDSS
jgi:hypothetical protein